MNFNKYHVSKNLLDLTALINAPSGTFTTEDGTETFTADHLLTIQGKPNTYYRMSSNYDRTGNKKNIIYLQYADVIKAVTSVISPLYKTDGTGVLKVAMYTSRDGANDFINGDAWVMLNEGTTALPFEPPGNTWVDSHYIHNTSTDTITTLPADLYANDTTATVGLKGNMEQNGTPSPDNPIIPQGTGERTGNLFDIESWLISKGAVFSKDGNAYTFSASQSMFSTPFYFSDTDIPVSISGIITDITAYNTRINLLRANGTTAKAYAITALTKVKKNENIVCAGLQFDWSTAGTMRIDSLMLNTGSTALPYEPYGYKIPISSANTTTPVYLGAVESTRKIKKLVLTGKENIAKNVADPNNYLYYWWYNKADAAKNICKCTHLGYATNYPSSGEINSSLVGGLFYFNLGKTTMDAQTSGNTATGFKEYLAAQYANGTPVTIWYILTEPTTGVVNEPLMKIGDYADTVSGITIPTITGKDTFDVLTTLKPSEVTVNYKGWHPVQNVHEKSKNLFDYSTVTIGKYISASGEEETSSGTGEQSLNHSDYITVNAGMTYTFKCDKSLIESATFNAFCWFDSNKQFINRAVFDVGATDPYILCTATAPTGTAYLIMNYRGLHGDTAMLNAGSTALPYEPYWK